MPIPEHIPVRFSEEEASYVSARPVFRQQFTLRELLDMILAGTGKQPQRIREILHAGTFIHNIYRYWWEGFAVEEAALAALLAEFPDPDPGRAFSNEECAWVKLSDASIPMPRTATVEKAEASVRRWFRGESFWDFLMAFANSKQPAYFDYSYHRHADLYRVELSARDRTLVAAAIRRLAARGVRMRLGRLDEWAVLELACPRHAVEKPTEPVQG